VGDLEALQAVAVLGFLTHDIQHRVDQLCAFGVMTLGPVVTGARLTKDKVVGTEEMAERTGTHAVHGARFQVDKDGAWNVLASTCLVVVNGDTLELQINVADVGAGGVNTVFVGDDFPELGANLVATLAGLQMHDLTHGRQKSGVVARPMMME